MGGRSKASRPWAVPDFLAEPDDLERQRWASTVLNRYFLGQLDDGAPAYTGSMFERFAGDGDRADTANRFTADDLVAVSMLSVSVDPRAALRILDDDADELSALLGKIPLHIDLVDTNSGLVAAGSEADQLWWLVNRHHGLGEVTTSKLLARKRPRLLPVIDSVVRRVLSITDSSDYWCDMRAYLQQDPRRWTFLKSVHNDSDIPAGISTLRCFDVLLWMSQQPGCPTPTWESLD